jgi:Ca-activated chloride channel family protein
MKAKIAGRSKIDVAKDTVSDLVGQMSPDTRVGLIAYGHRDKNNCQDVELLMPVGRVNRDDFEQKIRSLQPLGQTPISYSIRQAADVLKGQDGRKTIILISDGEETCKEDPCAVAAELKKANVDLQIHVVGFGIDTEAAKKQLHCIAESTGGVYKDAASAGELKKTLEGLAKGDAGDLGTLVSNIKDADGNALRYFVEFYKPGDANTRLSEGLRLEPMTPASDAPVKLAPGTYDVRYWSSTLPTVWKRGVVITAGEETRVDVEQFGRIRVSIKDRQGNTVQMYADIFSGDRPEEKVAGIYYSNSTQDLPAGTYNISCWMPGLPKAEKTGIQVRSGSETTVEIVVDK